MRRSGLGIVGGKISGYFLSSEYSGDFRFISGYVLTSNISGERSSRLVAPKPPSQVIGISAGISFFVGILLPV